jgi:hypothetical protein
MEMAHQLRQQGERVDLLLLVDIAPGEERVLVLLRSVLERFGPRIGLDFDRQFATYVFLRRMLRNYHHMMNLRGQERLRFAQMWATKGVVRLVLLPLASMVLRSRPTMNDPAPLTPEVALSRVNDGPVMARFSWAHTRYRTRRFDGKLPLLYARDELDPATLLAAWQRVPQEVELIPIRGTHVTCRTNHVEALAEELTRQVEKIEKAIR